MSACRAEQWHDLTTDDHKPLLNKVTMAGIYPPGSTFKTVVATGGRSNAGIATPDYHVTCNGIDSISAVMPSIAGSIMAATAHWMSKVASRTAATSSFMRPRTASVSTSHTRRRRKKLGLGAITGIELPGEHSGLMPSK